MLATNTGLMVTGASVNFEAHKVKRFAQNTSISTCLNFGKYVEA